MASRFQQTFLRRDGKPSPSGVGDGKPPRPPVLWGEWVARLIMGIVAGAFVAGAVFFGILSSTELSPDEIVKPSLFLGGLVLAVFLLVPRRTLLGWSESRWWDQRDAPLDIPSYGSRHRRSLLGQFLTYLFRL